MITLYSSPKYETDEIKSERFDSFRAFSEIVSPKVLNNLTEWDMRNRNGLRDLSVWALEAKEAGIQALNDIELRDKLLVRPETHRYANALINSEPGISGHKFGDLHEVVDAVYGFSSGITTAFDIRAKFGTYLISRTNEVAECIQGQTRTLSNQVSVGHAIAISSLNYLIDTPYGNQGQNVLDMHLHEGLDIQQTIGETTRIIKAPEKMPSVFHGLFQLISELNKTILQAYQNGEMDKPMKCPQRDAFLPIEGTSTTGRQLQRSAFNSLLDATNISELNTIKNMKS